MQVGSTVECTAPQYYPNIKIKANVLYTISNIYTCPCGCQLEIANLEEIRGPIDYITGLEHGIELKDLKELLPPIDINKLINS